VNATDVVLPPESATPSRVAHRPAADRHEPPREHGQRDARRTTSRSATSTTTIGSTTSPAPTPSHTYIRARIASRRRTRMPANTRRPNPYEDAGSEAINAMVARVAPAILELLADGAPRTKPAIVEALAGRHDRQDVVHALIRLAVTGQVEESGGRYALGAAGERL
jgi:hypothetical protein